MKKSSIITLTLILLGVACLVTLQTASAKRKPAAVTFTKDVAPIFNAKCTQCHRPGEPTPFSTLTYKDARPWAKSIKEKVVSREMPPWHADPHIGQWANDRRLSEAEIKTIVAWVDGGAVEGNPKDLPPAPKFAEGWNIPTPDVVLQMEEEYVLAASGPDEYQYFDVPTNFAEDKYVQMAEARPGNRKVVHHIIAFVVPPGQPTLNKIKKENRDKALEMSLAGTPLYRDGSLIRLKKDAPVYDNGADVPQKLRGFNNVDDFLTAYAPGHNPDEWKPGTAKKVPAGATIRFQVHYSKVSGSEQKDRSMVGLIFAKEKPQKTLNTRAIANSFFAIPANAPRHKVTAEWTAWRDTTIYTLMPHMHYRGAAMEYKVTYPDGKSEVLLNVPNYSFAWQAGYILKTPKTLPKSSKITVTGYFDNTAKNKFNPDPNQVVRYGEPTYDEMMMGFMDYTTEWPAIVKVDPQVFADYVGKYDRGEGRSITIMREGDKLINIAADGKTKFELAPIGKDRFRMLDTENEVTFIRNDKGEVIERLMEFDGGAMRNKKIKDVATSGQ
ncbi:MAG TPA: cytochrome c [Blastocatellia bacterium]|nr:cytochrome c [Blastocatellia bacterium]